MQSMSHRCCHPFKSAALVAAAAAALLTVGCGAAPQALSDPASASTRASIAASGNATDTAADTDSATMDPDQRDDGGDPPYSSQLVVPNHRFVKAGELIPVTGGTYQPGTTITIYAGEPVPYTYDEANDMYTPTGDVVVITDKLTVVTDSEGKFSVTLPLPANLVPQQRVDIYAEASAPAANGSPLAMTPVSVQ